MDVRAVHDGLVLGYANLAEPAIEEGIRRLARGRSRSSSWHRRAASPRTRRRDREVVVEHPVRQAPALERADDRGAARRGGHLPDGALGVQQPAELALVARRRRRRSGRSACSRLRRPSSTRAQLAPAGEAEVERGADALGGQRQAVPGGVAGEEHAVLDRAAQLVRDPVALVALAPAAPRSRASLHGRLLDVVARPEGADAHAQLLAARGSSSA